MGGAAGWAALGKARKKIFAGVAVVGLLAIMIAVVVSGSTGALTHQTTTSPPTPTTSRSSSQGGGALKAAQTAFLPACEHYQLVVGMAQENVNSGAVNQTPGSICICIVRQLPQGEGTAEQIADYENPSPSYSCFYLRCCSYLAGLCVSACELVLAA